MDVGRDKESQGDENENTIEDQRRRKDATIFWFDTQKMMIENYHRI